MTVFVNYIFHESMFGGGEPDLTVVETQDLNVHVPPGAVGFTFAEAEDEVEAKNKLKDCPSYFLGDEDSALTIDEMEEIRDSQGGKYDEDLISFMRMKLILTELTNKDAAAMNIPPVVGYFFIHMHSQIGMTEKDVVIDPETREVVYQYPKNKL